jgi:hypothetical protein
MRLAQEQGEQLGGTFVVVQPEHVRVSRKPMQGTLRQGWE